MLNIFADALLIAARLGQVPDAFRRPSREGQDIDLMTSDALRRQVR